MERSNTATYIANRTISKNDDLTPYEHWFGSKPDVNNFKIFGQHASVLIPEPHRTKLGPKGKLMNFVGYTDNYQTFRFFDPEKKVVITSFDVRFTNYVGSINDTIPASTQAMTTQIPMMQNNQPITQTQTTPESNASTQIHANQISEEPLSIDNSFNFRQTIDNDESMRLNSTLIPTDNHDQTFKSTVSQLNADKSASMTDLTSNVRSKVATVEPAGLEINREKITNKWQLATNTQI